MVEMVIIFKVVIMVIMVDMVKMVIMVVMAIGHGYQALQVDLSHHSHHG